MQPAVENDPRRIRRPDVEETPADVREGLADALRQLALEVGEHEPREERGDAERARTHRSKAGALKQMSAQTVEHGLRLREGALVVDDRTTVHEVETRQDVGPAHVELGATPVRRRVDLGTKTLPEVVVLQERVERAPPEVRLSGVLQPLRDATQPLRQQGILGADRTRVGERDVLEARLDDPVAFLPGGGVRPLQGIDHARAQPQLLEPVGVLTCPLRQRQHCRHLQPGLGELHPGSRFHSILFVHATGKHRTRHHIPAKNKRTVKDA